MDPHCGLPRHRPRVAALVALGALTSAGLAACSSTPATQAVDAPPCPTTAIAVAVTVDQWSDLVRTLAGSCATVKTIVASSSTDPHDFEPTAGDALTLTKAAVVVENGLDYDPWADKAIATDSSPALVVNAGEVVGRKEGDNPHLWYSPSAINSVATAVTAALTKALPAAAGYFNARTQAWDAVRQPYDAAVAATRAEAIGKSYAATESVFDDMAEALGLLDVTPDGYRRAAANETDPAPGDVNALEQLLSGKGASVLIYNTQTEGAVPKQLRAVAQKAGVPVVEVTETVAPKAKGFVDWQVRQLQALQQALR